MDGVERGGGGVANPLHHGYAHTYQIPWWCGTGMRLEIESCSLYLEPTQYSTLYPFTT